MCNTPQCFGDCDQCLRQKEIDKEQEEESSVCPYRKECKWVTVDPKQDICTTCGKTSCY